jgi:hypothetical protein
MRRIMHRLALGAIAGCALLSPAVAQATTRAEAVTKGVEYVKKVQKSESATGAPLFGGDWALTSLAAAGTAAANLQRGEGTANARGWYRSFIEKPSTWPGVVENPATEYEKAALVSYAAGIDPARVSAEQNLLARILSEYQKSKPGYYGKPSIFEGTVFGLLALADTKTTGGVKRIPQPLLQKSIEVIERNKHTDGGWNYQQAEGSETIKNSAAEPDTTGAAIAALCTAGVSPSASVIANAEEFLKSILTKEGEFESEFGANADSNAWAVQGLNACGVNAETFKKKSEAGYKSPVEFLISLQVASGTNKGAFLYKTGGSVSNYASQDALRALAGGGFTAEPPVPTGGAAQWLFSESFLASTKSQLALVINNGSTLEVCSVEVEPGAVATMPLATVLTDAETKATPSGCVMSFEPASGEGAITKINGTAGTWKVSLNGATEKTAERGTAVGLGVTIYLTL